MTRHEFLCWFTALFLSVRLAKIGEILLYPQEPSASALGAIELIAWGCAALILWRDRESAPATRAQAAVLLAVLLASAAPIGPFTAVGLTIVAVMVLVQRSWSSAERRVGLIFLAVATQRLWSKAVLVFFAGTILRLDTAAAGWLLRAVEPGSSWTGNMLKPPNDVGVTVNMACSSFANLSLVWLCFVSLAALDGVRWSWRTWTALLAACLTVILLNSIRLLLMARSIAAYHYWHDDAGAQIFGVAVSLVTVALCSLGPRWSKAAR